MKAKLLPTARAVLLIALSVGIFVSLKPAADAALWAASAATNFDPAKALLMLLTTIGGEILCVAGIRRLVRAKLPLNMGGAVLVVLALLLVYTAALALTEPGGTRHLAFVRLLGRRDFRGASLSRASLGSARFAGADLSEADLSDAYLHYADLSGADLKGANLTGAELVSADLRGADLRGADLRGASLWMAEIDDNTQIDAKWLLVWRIRNGDAKGKAFPGVDLSEANLYCGFLQGTDLSGANLTGVDLRGGSLSDAVLTGADLTGADLESADLRRAYLGGAILSGADLRWADLSEANLSGTIVTDEQLALARSLKDAIMPDGSRHP